MVEKRYALIGVEGNHDQAFLCRLLCKSLEFKKLDAQFSTIDSYWKKFIPQYPPRTGKLHARLDMPSLLWKEDLVLAIYVGEGNNLAAKLSAKLADINLDRLVAFGIIADSDNNYPEQVASKYSSSFQEFFPDFPNTPGEVADGSLRSGIYVLPDNSNTGVLENILCKCGENVYASYMQRAQAYIEQFSDEEIRKMKWKPYDRQKAVVATVVSVLKPGKTNTTSISDNDWICDKSLKEVSELSQLSSFLNKLLQ